MISSFTTSLKIFTLVCISLIFFSACKKDKKTEEALPKLGTCQPVEAGTGLTLVKEGEYLYQSAEGVSIRIIREEFENTASLTTTIGYSAYPNFTAELWGEVVGTSYYPAMHHENLNGKHIKDRIGASRTILFPNGAKITAVAAGPEKGVTAITIYDGAVVHHFNTTCFTLEYSVTNETIAKRLDEMQADGETSAFDITETGLKYYNIYTEDTPGQKVEKRVELGELNKSNPTQVNDYYDDPRLAHT